MIFWGLGPVGTGKDWLEQPRTAWDGLELGWDICSTHSGRANLDIVHYPCALNALPQDREILQSPMIRPQSEHCECVSIDIQFVLYGKLLF